MLRIERIHLGISTCASSIVLFCEVQSESQSARTLRNCGDALNCQSWKMMNESSA